MVDAESELQKHESVFEDMHEQRLELERQAAEWLDGHPTYQQEFQVFEEKPEPYVTTTRFDHLNTRDEIGDEWDFSFKFGFLCGMKHILTKLDHETAIPYEITDDE